MNPKIFVYAKYAALVQAIVIIPSFILGIILDRYRGGWVAYPRISLLVSIFFLTLITLILLAYIRIGTEKGLKYFIYLLILSWMISVADNILSVVNNFLIATPEVFTILSVILDGIFSILIAFYFIRLSKFYNLLKPIGILLIIVSILSLFNTFVPVSDNLFIGLLFLLSFISYSVLITIVSVMEFLLFSRLVKKG